MCVYGKDEPPVYPNRSLLSYKTLAIQVVGNVTLFFL